MSSRWSGLGRRALVYALVLGCVALAAGWIVSQPSEVGYSTAVAGIPVNRTVPAITGDQRLGGALTCSRGTWDDPETGAQYGFAFQWVRDNVELTGRTDAQYTVTTADVGRSLRCTVRATGSSGSTSTTSATLTPPAPRTLTSPRLSGDLRLGQTLHCSRGTWDDQGIADYVTTYSWLRDAQAIAGATAATYALTRADIGRSITCRVSVDVLASSISNGVVPTAPAIHSLPAVTGDARLGGTLSCLRGEWDDESLAPYAITRQWLRNGAELLGATGESYAVKLTDVNQAIACRVRAEALTDATSASIAPTAPTERSQPGIEGDPRLGRTLTCTRGAWDDGGREAEYGVTYEWYRAGVFVSSGAQFPVNPIDAGKVLRCQTIVEGLTTSASPNLTAPLPVNVAPPMLSGDARLGRTVACDRGTWDDQGVDPYAVAYQWLRAGVVIAGAVAPTYTITAEDVTRSVSCRVTAAALTSATSAGVSIPAPESQLVPRVEGDPRIDAELTCTRGDWDDPAGGPYAVTYQWYRNTSTVIAGATAAIYKPVTGDASIHCRVRAADLTTASSAALTVTAAATGGKPAVLIAPAISGDRRLRKLVTCHRGSWNDTAAARYPVTYRWRRNAVAIEGATAAQYTITAADMGQTLTCEVTADNGAPGSTSALTPSLVPAAPRSVVVPGISGVPRLRGTLSCARGGWFDEPTDRYAVTYRWLRGATAISGATDATYQVALADIGQSLTCEVRAEGLTSSTSPILGGSAPRSILGPVLTGNPRLRKTVGCSRGTWDDVAADRYAVAYTWQRGATTITGQTDPSYGVTAADTGAAISCTVRAESLTNAGPFNGAETVRAPLNRVLPRLSGHPRVRQTLTCTRGDWDDDAADRYAVIYRWLRGGTAIPDATASTYVTTAADAGTNLSCRVRAEDATDATSATLAIRRPTNVLAPAITGEPRLSRTLSCTRGDWDDTTADRYGVTYSWLRAGTPIPGATSPTYTLVRDDVARAMSCRVRAEDATDATSATVTTLAPQVLLRPMLSGQPHLRGELACTRGTWDDTPEQRYAVSYQWYRASVPINGATNPTYVVGTADLGRSISCSATAEVLSESFATAVSVANPTEATMPRIEGIAHPRRELTCTRGEWNDSPGKRYVTTYKWRRNGVTIADADGPDRIVTAQDVGTSLTCTVTAEGLRTVASPAVTPAWEPLRLSLAPDADASAPGTFNAYTARLRNENPVPVTVTQFDLTLPGGFSFRPGTTTGALTADPVPTGPGSLILRWTPDFVVPGQGEAVLRIGVTTASELGDHLASARAYPTSTAFTIPIADRVARIAVEGAEPAAGACTIVGTDGPDVLIGTPGSDVICGFGGDDVLRGMGGGDELWGGPGDDRLDGGDGADVLRGGDGADVLDGGLGADLLRGGGGVDTLLYTSRDASVFVTVGFTNGDDGEAGEGDTVGSDIEIVRGGQGDDTLIGGLGPEELYGRGGNDTLDGGPGAGDLLDGGDGNDTLIARDGLIDRLICGGDVDRYDADILDRIIGCETPFVAGTVLP